MSARASGAPASPHSARSTSIVRWIRPAISTASPYSRKYDIHRQPLPISWRPDPQSKALERHTGLVVPPTDRHGVVKRAAAEIRAHGDDEIASTAVEALPEVIGRPRPQALVVEQTKPAALRIYVGVDLVDEVLVAEHALDLRSPTRNEGHGWKPVARSQDRLRNLGVCRRVMGRNNPSRLGSLGHRSTSDSGHRLALAVDLRPCPTHATPHVTAAHEVGHMQRRSQAGAVAGEVRVFVRATSARGHLPS